MNNGMLAQLQAQGGLSGAKGRLDTIAELAKTDIR